VVVPILWHRRTTSLKTTSQISFFPPMVGLFEVPLGWSTSLSRLKDDFWCTVFALGGDNVCPDFAPLGGVAGAEAGAGTRGRSCKSCREGLGAARAYEREDISCERIHTDKKLYTLFLSSPSIRARTSRVLSRSSFWIFSSSMLRTIFSTSATICKVLSYSKVEGSV
jgi:hypothetical protein